MFGGFFGSCISGIVSRVQTSIPLFGSWTFLFHMMQLLMARLEGTLLQRLPQTLENQEKTLILEQRTTSGALKKNVIVVYLYASIFKFHRGREHSYKNKRILVILSEAFTQLTAVLLNLAQVNINPKLLIFLRLGNILCLLFLCLSLGVVSGSNVCLEDTQSYQNCGAKVPITRRRQQRYGRNENWIFYSCHPAVVKPRSGGLYQLGFLKRVDGHPKTQRWFPLFFVPMIKKRAPNS